MYQTTIFSCFVCSLLIQEHSCAASYKNVFGSELKSCSSDGMALTGYSRTGYCVDKNDDSGSHHICIDLSSTSGGNFCDVTGQDDWCSSEMSCHDFDSDDDGTLCQVQNWCVCQWAFATYIQQAGGCDKIQDVSCDAINMQAITAYEKHAFSNSKYEAALQCLVDRCGISLTLASRVKYFMMSTPGRALIFVSYLSIYGLYRHRIQQKVKEGRETLLQPEIGADYKTMNKNQVC